MLAIDAFALNPNESRRILRDRLDRLLRQRADLQPNRRSGGWVLSDVELLELLVALNLEPSDNVAKVRSAHEARRVEHPELPDFERLIEDGWFSVTWGRVVTELNLGAVARRQPAPLDEALAQIFAARRDQAAYSLTDGVTLSEAGERVARNLIETPARVSRLSSPAPEWVAARLWERRPPGDDKAALRWWVDRCRLLGTPTGAPSQWWSTADARAWRAAAFEVLSTDPGLPEWEREKELVDASFRHEGRWAPTGDLPQTLVERWVWLNEHGRDAWARASELCGDTWILLSILLADLAVDAGETSPSAGDLLEVVIARPTLTVLLASRIREEPKLLADVLLHSATSAWGCMMIVHRHPQSIQHWARSVQESDASDFQERAVVDAMAVVVDQLRDGEGVLPEVAQLLVWLHSQSVVPTHAQRARRFRSSAQMLAALHSELRSIPEATLRGLLDVLSFRDTEGLGSPRFTAALDLAECVGLVDAIDADRAVTAYVASLGVDKLRYSAIGLSAAQASALARAASRSSLFEAFLAPLAEGQTTRAPDRVVTAYEARFIRARALRAHIRVLSRAIVGWLGPVPRHLIAALTDAITSGATESEVDEGVSAFAAHHESGVMAPRINEPLVVEVADACVRVPEDQRGELDAALLRINEPMALAQLLRRAPRSLRDRIAQRLDALGDEESAPTRSLTEVQARIEELLNAGAMDAAERHMATERELTTWGPVAGRSNRRLRWRLRLALHRKAYDEIRHTELPPELAPGEETDARDALDFFTGLAELGDPSGDAARAEALFARLADAHRDEPAYVLNRFAAYLTRVVGRNGFRVLDLSEVASAREEMDRADRDLDALAGARDRDVASHATNRALLFLALGQNEEALAALARADSREQSEGVAALSAVALTRMGREEEARAVLAEAEVSHPDSSVVREAREHLRSGTPGRFGVATARRDDPLGAIERSLYRLTLLDAEAQAQVFGRDLASQLVHEVCAAAANVTSLVPHLPSDKLREDDVSALLHRILEPQVRLLGWSVADQSRGGFTANGNPGERDLVVRKDGYDLAAIEAVKCNRNPDTKKPRDDLAGHLMKLLGYSRCRVFFLVVYAYVPNAADVVAVLRDVMSTQAPAGFVYLRAEEVRHEDARPSGWAATYRAPGGEDVKVIGLVMDMLQAPQRAAAISAGRVRTAKSKKGST